MSANSLRRAAAILFLLIFSFLFQPAWSQSAESRISLSETETEIRLTLSAPGRFTVFPAKNSGNIQLFFYASPIEEALAPQEMVLDSGLIKKIALFKNGNTLVVRTDNISFPHHTITRSAAGNEVTVTISKRLTEEAAAVRPKFIKKTSSYRAGESMLQDLSVVMEASGRKETVPGFLPIEKTAVAGLKKSFMENMELITKSVSEAQAASPAFKKLGRENSFSMLPIEKSEKINTEFKDRNITEILFFLANKTGRNLVTAPQVKGKKTIVFKDMTAEEAIALLLADSGFEYKIQSDTVLVGPAEVIGSLSPRLLTKPEETRQRKVVVLKNIRGESVMRNLENLFPEGEFLFNPNLNAFEITAPESVMEEIEAYFRQRDHRET